MTITVTISDGALAVGEARPCDGAGAWVSFEGIVRGDEAGRPISALVYETYEPMAQRVLTSLGEELASRHGLLAVHVEHSRGRVAVGGCSFRLSIASAHRKEALAAMDEFIDRMKRDAPIWKRPQWAVTPMSA